MRLILDSLNKQFSILNERSMRLLDVVPHDIMFAKPTNLRDSIEPCSTGEYVLRSAAAAEQAFNGITTRLWDDPFEWTLPEELSTADKIRKYLSEVDDVRIRAFGYLKRDEDLSKQIPAPVELRSITCVLTCAITRSAHYQGRAYAILQFLGRKPPAF